MIDNLLEIINNMSTPKIINIGCDNLEHSIIIKHLICKNCNKFMCNIVKEKYDNLWCIFCHSSKHKIIYNDHDEYTIRDRVCKYCCAKYQNICVVKVSKCGKFIPALQYIKLNLPPINFKNNCKTRKKNSRKI